MDDVAAPFGDRIAIIVIISRSTSVPENHRRIRLFLTLIGCVAIGIVVGNVSVSSAASPTSVPVQERYSPLGATANGASGPATAKFTVGPFCCPSTAVVLAPQQIITDTDTQWLNLGLPWDNTTVNSIQVCYAINTAVPGRTYISQTRLTTMTTPNAAFVRVDDGTNRTAVGPTCYTVPAGFTPNGALTFELRVVFGSTSDRITLGMVSLSGLSE